MPPVIAGVIGAELVAIGVGAITAGIIGTIASIVVSLALSYGLSELSSLLAPGAPKQPAPHASRQNYRNAVAPRTKCVGRDKVGGAIALLEKE